jgi:hypothetical protein
VPAAFLVKTYGPWETTSQLESAVRKHSQIILTTWGMGRWQTCSTGRQTLKTVKIQPFTQIFRPKTTSKSDHFIIFNIHILKYNANVNNNRI